MKRLTFLLPPFLMALAVSVWVRSESATRDDYPSAEIRVLTRALHYIENNYVDPSHLQAHEMLAEAARELERSMAPLVIRDQPKKVEVSWGGDRKTVIDLPEPFKVDDLPPVLRRLLGFLQVAYVGKLEPVEREHLTLSGLMATLDPHSNFLSPKIYNEFRIGTKGNFGGLGIVIGIRDGYLTVISPLEGTPAHRAGIRSKDRIVQIGEEATINMSLTEAVERLRGPVGSKVGLAVHREGMPQPLNFNLTRDLIQIRSVGGTMVTGTRFGLLKLKNFQEDTLREMERQLALFRKGGAPLEGLILDVRNNPGGLLDQAVQIADRFLNAGVIVKTVGAKGREIEADRARPGDTDETLPIVVLVNEGSASASEIIAGAFQFNHRALVVGNRTFGKGTVQTVYDLKDGSALKLTIAKYLAGGDHEVQNVGIIPDIKLVPASVDAKRVDLFEDEARREEDGDEEEGRPPPPPPVKEAPPSRYEVRYLEESGSEEEKEERAVELKPEEDFPVRLAAEILKLPESRAFGFEAKERLLKAVGGLVERLGQEEEVRLAEALKKVSIDWSNGKADGRASATARLEVLDLEGHPRESVMAGQSAVLKVTVENRGKTPLYRLVGVTRCDDPLFANLEFPIGRLNPGERREWRHELKVPEFLTRRSEPVEIFFHEAYGHEPKRISFTLRVETPPPSRFSYTYEIWDGGLAGTSGNQDRKVDPGEKVGLQVRVTNAGEGSSEQAVVNLKNLGGEEIFIEKGRSDLGSLRPGQSGGAFLVFQVGTKNLPPKFPFELAIQDGKFGWGMVDPMEIPVGVGAPTPPTKVLQSPPSIRLQPADPSLAVSREVYPLKGLIEDDREVRHLTIFLGSQKVFYLSPKEPSSKSLSFETDLRLKKGINRILVTAQDDRELTTSRSWVVWRE